MEAKQNNLISTVKGVCIILMVIGHSGCPDYIHNFIYMFHMPIFFFCSGYCFNEKNLNNSITFFKKRIKGLYFPFIKYSLLALLLHNILFYLHIFDNQYSFKEILVSAFNIVIRMKGNPNDATLTGTFWFFRQLFFASVVGYFYIKHFKKYILTGTIASLIVSFILNVTEHGIPFIDINYICFMSLFFFLLGYYISKKDFKLSSIQCLCAFTIVVIGSIYFPSEMLFVKASRLIPYSLCAVSGIFFLFNLLNKFSIKSLIYIGNNSIYIMIWHFLCFKLISYIIILTYKLPIDTLSQHPVITEYASQGWWIAYAVIGSSIPLFFIKITENIRN